MAHDWQQRRMIEAEMNSAGAWVLLAQRTVPTPQRWCEWSTATASTRPDPGLDRQALYRPTDRNAAVRGLRRRAPRARAELGTWPHCL